MALYTLETIAFQPVCKDRELRNPITSEAVAIKLRYNVAGTFLYDGVCDDVLVSCSHLLAVSV